MSPNMIRRRWVEDCVSALRAGVGFVWFLVLVLIGRE